MSFFAPVFAAKHVSPRVEDAVGRAMLSVVTCGNNVAPDYSETVAQRRVKSRRMAVSVMQLKGMTVGQIASELGVCRDLIWKDHRAMGLQAIKDHREIHSEVAERRAMVAAMQLNGLTYQEIADLLDIKFSQVASDIHINKKSGNQNDRNS